MNGKLIVLYGINNIGKTTQAEMLVDALIEAGFEAEYMKYPRYEIEPSGPYINSVIREGVEASPEELQMWYALNRHQSEKILKEKLDKGKVVVAEDYTGTGIAWGMTYGVKKEWLEAINENLIKEDVGILMTGARHITGIEEDHANETDDEAMERSKEVHEELGKAYGWKSVDASGTIDEVHDRIMEEVLEHFNE